MDELMDMMATDESPSQISDKIKDILFAKSAERVDGYRPDVASSLFGDEESEVDDENEVDAEVDTDVEAEADTEVEAEIEPEVPSDEVEKSTAKVF
tara:strand:+ start:433 stop:720 length:288 start_codon:yes stop_codon:yes gene_type:complete